MNVNLADGLIQRLLSTASIKKPETDILRNNYPSDKVSISTKAVNLNDNLKLQQSLLKGVTQHQLYIEENDTFINMLNKAYKS